MASASSADGTDRRASIGRSSTWAGPTCQVTSASGGRIAATLRTIRSNGYSRVPTVTTARRIAGGAGSRLADSKPSKTDPG